MKLRKHSHIRRQLNMSREGKLGTLAMERRSRRAEEVEGYENMNEEEAVEVGAVNGNDRVLWKLIIAILTLSFESFRVLSVSLPSLVERDKGTKGFETRGFETGF